MIELLLEAERALSMGRADRAELLYRQVAAGDPRNSIAVVGLARVALERADDAGALVLARQALSIDGDNVAAQRLVQRLEEVLTTRGEALPVEAAERRRRRRPPSPRHSPKRHLRPRRRGARPRSMARTRSSATRSRPPRRRARPHRRPSRARRHDPPPPSHRGRAHCSTACVVAEPVSFAHDHDPRHRWRRLRRLRLRRSVAPGRPPGRRAR